MAYGRDVFGEVKYGGTFYIKDTEDNDWLGYIFSYQDRNNFYLFSAAKWNTTISQGPWSVKRINLANGENPTMALRPHTEIGSSKILWQYQPTDTPYDPNNRTGSYILCLHIIPLNVTFRGLGGKNFLQILCPPSAHEEHNQGIFKHYLRYNPSTKSFF